MIELEQLREGQTVVLELVEERVIGELVKVRRTHLTLRDVRNLNTNVSMGGTNQFYVSEIKALRVLQNDHEDETTVAEPASSKPAQQPLVTLSAFVVDKIGRKMKEHVHISMVDAAFHDAVRAMKASRWIGVSLEDVSRGRHSRVSLLLVTTEERIFLFDLIYLGQKLPELKTVFEASTPGKIIHDSKTVVDYLSNVLRIRPVNIFDTLVAHFVLEQDRQFITVETLIERTFGLPLSPPDESLPWTTRPLKEELKPVALQRVAYLLDLHHAQNTRLLRPLFTEMERYATCRADDPTYFEPNRLNGVRTENDVDTNFELEIPEKSNGQGH